MTESRVKIESVLGHPLSDEQWAAVSSPAEPSAIVAGAEEGLEIAEYTATQVKQAIAGTGGADKEQVQMMVMHLLKLVQKPQIDASDALAIALCHAHHRQSLIPHGLVGAKRRAGRLRL